MLQLSYDRLDHLFLCIKQWQGPMQIVVYCTDAEAQRMKNNKTLTDVLQKRGNIAIHVVYKRMVNLIKLNKLFHLCILLCVSVHLLIVVTIQYLDYGSYSP